VALPIRSTFLDLIDLGEIRYILSAHSAVGSSVTLGEARAVRQGHK